MNTKHSEEIFAKNAENVKRVSKEECCVTPWLFQHQDLIHDIEDANPVNREALTNTLNYINFMDRFILAHLRHPKYEESILVRAYPEPCLGEELTCQWTNENLLGINLKSYQFLHFVIDDGRSMIMVPAEPLEINDDSLMVRLPEISYAVGQRQTRRYACNGITAELIQSGFVANGELLDFSSNGFRLRVKPESSSSFHWFNPDESVVISLRSNKTIFFSGTCRCIRQQEGLEEREIVLAPIDKKVNRLEKKKIRNPRQRLVPSPSLIFHHPFLRKRVQLEVSNISTSGFSLFEKKEEGILMPGMIIPELVIQFAGALEIKCTARVVYRLEGRERGVRCEFSILDMGIDTYSRLTHILSNALDSHAHISSDLDMDALWEFFFESGFIYPKKYRLIHSNRGDFKETYQKLYQKNPEIARHFTYQRNGKIYGHISMVRAYEKAWMIHHHAAITMDSKRPGFMVLKQIMRYLNDMYSLPSAKIDHVMCYFRPENKFPDRVFGSFARALENPRGCSLDLFCYLPYTCLSLGNKLPEGWALEESSALDLWELNRFYNHFSGGLLLNAINLEKKGYEDESLEEVYRRLGFFRKWRAYSLKYKEALNAVLIVNQSDLGFNLSELLNGITVLVTNPKDLRWNVLSIAISQLTGIYNTDRIPILFYPFDYVKDQNIPYEKLYQLWILDVRYGDEYLEYMQRKFRIGNK